MEVNSYPTEFFNGCLVEYINDGYDVRCVEIFIKDAVMCYKYEIWKTPIAIVITIISDLSPADLGISQNDKMNNDTIL